MSSNINLSSANLTCYSLTVQHIASQNRNFRYALKELNIFHSFTSEFYIMEVTFIMNVLQVSPAIVCFT
jgi:hypothetical protein